MPKQIRNLLLTLTFLSIAFLFLLPVFNSHQVWAQGNCDCGYECVVVTDNCDAGSIPVCGTSCSCACGGGGVPTGNCDCGYDCVVVTDNCDSTAGFSPACGALCSCACGGGTVPPPTPFPIPTPPTGHFGEIDLGGAFQDALVRGVGYFAKFAVGIGGGLALLLLIFGGIKYVTSAGKPDEIKEAQSIISAAIIGILVILLSALILNTMGATLIPGWS